MFTDAITLCCVDGALVTVPHSVLFIRGLNFMRGKSDNGWLYEIPKEQGKKEFVLLQLNELQGIF